jgi:hypothetical protein
MVVTVSIDRARQAMQHRDISWIFASTSSLPKEYRDNPAVLRSLMRSAVEGDPSLSNTSAFQDAYGALHEAERVSNLRDTIGRLANDPKVQLAASDRGIDWYLARPAAIREALRDPKIAAQLGVNLAHEIGVATIESQQFMEANGIVEPAPAEVPLPTNASKAESELADLRRKSVTKGLSKAEDARLAALYEARVARDGDAASEEMAAHAKALGMRDRPAGEYGSLIEKSVTGKLTPDEDARLTEMSGARAVAQGLVTQDDLDAETE